VWQVEIGVFPVAWPAQCDEWAFYLSRILGERNPFGLPAEGNYGAGEVVLRPPSFDSPVRSSMRVRPHADGIVCAVFAPDEDVIDEDQVRPWQDAAAAAILEFGQHYQDFTWQAVLGPHPNSPDWLRFGPLGDQEKLGPVQLAPGGVLMREFSGPARARIDQPWPGCCSWPVAASGTIRTYDGEVALYRCRHDAYRTCALLSLLCARYWLPRSGPDIQRPGFPDLGPVRVPQSVGQWDDTGHPDSSLPADFNTYKDDDPLLAIPPWMAHAWTLLERDEIIRASLYAYYEAIGLEMDHPSAAFLVYVAAIEGIGTRLAHLKRCDCCEECDAQIGAQRRFRKALKTVMSNKKVEQLAYAYDTRSKTGHEGQLFGTEGTYGYSGFSPFKPDVAGVFDLVMLGEIRNACRAVIAKTLGATPRRD
jgi:hypothetical protein